ncbi:unnamed protein product [Rotaria socialis]|uniref:Uncharacterized protein n=1 Tax=Rotaria socialis TaxID=392032 RepID=A0A821EQ71_9BILA|nr:unnamed protein product [Rotaria socialis]
MSAQSNVILKIHKNDQTVLLTPTSPPPYEIIQIDRVDPLPALNNNSHDEILTTPLLESVFTSFHRKRTVKIQSNQDISHFIIRSSLRSSSSTINAILELEHSPSVISLNQHHYSSSLLSAMTISNSNDTKRYHSGESIQFSPTKIERQALHSSNKQIQIITCQLTSI